MKTRRRCCLGLLALPLLALPACDRPEDAPPPADLVPKARMVRLMADLQQLEAQVENSRLPPDSARALFLAQQKDLLWKWEVTDSALLRSYRYYGVHGKDLPDLYQGVIDTLRERQYKFGAATPPPPGPPH